MSSSSEASDDGRSRSAMRAEMHPCEDDLLESGGLGPRDLGTDCGRRKAPRPAPRGRDNAVGARLATAGLRTQQVGRSATHARRDRRGARPSRAEGQPVLLVVGPETGNPRKRCDFVRAPRHVAAGRHDARRWVEAGDAAQSLPRALLCAGGHGAGVDHDEIRLLDAGLPSTIGAQAFLERERVGPVHAAPEGDDGELHLSDLLSGKAELKPRPAADQACLRRPGRATLQGRRPPYRRRSTQLPAAYCLLIFAAACSTASASLRL
jgi:hypothetical protein